MKNIPAIFFFFFLSFSASAQQTIKGRVVNEETGVAIPGSSVFISNTSKGTTTDNAGQFELYDVPAGKHDLVISCIGYETNVFSFTTDQLPLKLKVEMTVKVKELENVTIEPSVEEGWDKWGKTFMDYFIGSSENASYCKIKNEKAIKFRYYKKSNRLKAYCDEPLLIENKALGYNVRYQLEDFEIKFSDRYFLFTGYTLFEEMTGSRKGLIERWKRNRQTAYYGSVTHFMRSLFNNQLQQNGFEIRRAVRTPNTEKERVKGLYKKTIATKTTGGIMININDPLAGYPTDSVAYFQEVLKQDDYTEVIGKHLLTADSLLQKLEGEYKAMYFDDYLHITFMNEAEEEGYVRIVYPPRKAANSQQSYITLQQENYIAVDKRGNYYDPRNLFTSAYWAWSEKMANMLPVDYVVQEK